MKERKFKTISKLPGVPIGTIFEELPINEISIYKKNDPNLHSFWYAPVGQRIPIFDLNDIEESKDVFEEIIEPQTQTPKEIFRKVLHGHGFIGQLDQIYKDFVERLKENGHEINEKEEIEKPEEIKSEREDLARELKDAYDVGAECTAKISFKKLGKYRQGYLAEADMVLQNYVKKTKVVEIAERAFGNYFAGHTDTTIVDYLKHELGLTDIPDV